ncbi:EAL domain-containing protein [Vibrio sp. JPW-9-11-11]|uniref:EAL domain-containing protein n=1 Tax=Vibrio sp. JPW-9-11-11 TaxID=1416532 RepID=UPI001592BCE0|nr:EAL domain-containing protein [Vibrio sp. JPW-9-11-11]NVD07927.1 EAL domain-containing protein [Vibrio sp. JPW-9-11-11]
MILSTQQQFVDCLAMNNQDQYIAYYKQLTLSSVYQPIFDSAGTIVGVEALVRIQHAQQGTVRPDQFFHSSQYQFEDKMNVERLSRVIHIRNFARSKYRHLKLFLNVLPSTGEYLALKNIDTSLLAQRIKALNLDNSQIVMEVVELDAPDENKLKQAMNKLSLSGFRVAIDDYGVQASNRQRVEQLCPSIIKLDRSLLLAYIEGDQFPLLSGIQLAKKVNAQVVVEGIETEQQLSAMRQLDIDMFQGYYLATPEPLAAIYRDENTELRAIGCQM